MMFRLPDDSRKLLLWTRSMLLATVAAGGLLALSFFQVYSASRQPVLSAAPERINPNIASMASLVRLPGIGTARALDIIQYRQETPNGRSAFQTLGDMENIKGIGPKTAETMAPYLTFETGDKTE